MQEKQDQLAVTETQDERNLAEYGFVSEFDKHIGVLAGRLRTLTGDQDSVMMLDKRSSVAKVGEVTVYRSISNEQGDHWSDGLELTLFDDEQLFPSILTTYCLVEPLDPLISEHEVPYGQLLFSSYCFTRDGRGYKHINTLSSTPTCSTRQPLYIQRSNGLPVYQRSEVVHTRPGEFELIGQMLTTLMHKIDKYYGTRTEDTGQ